MRFSVALVAFLALAGSARAQGWVPCKINTGGHDLLNFCLDKAALTPVDGYLPVPEGPGLGVEIDEAAVREADKDRHSWRNPLFRTRDGSFAEW